MTRWSGHVVGRMTSRVPLAAVATLTVASVVVVAALLVGPPADTLTDAIEHDLRHFAWPVVLGVLIAAFLALQDRADRHERKLADAPLDQGERLRFK